MRNEQTYVVSPLVDYSANVNDLESLAGNIAEEIRNIGRGEYDSEATNPNLPRYDFEDSIESERPGWWRPVTANAKNNNDPTVEEWYQQAMEELKDQEDFRVEEGRKRKDSLTGENPPIEIYVEDREQITGTVSLKGSAEGNCIPVDKAIGLLSENSPRRDYNHSEVPSYSTEINDMDADVEADLSSGFFEVTAEKGPYTETSQVWMPYADREEALLVSMPSDFNDNELETNVVPVSEDSFTGNPMTDVVAESLSYFLPFEGILQTETSPEAINYRNENPLGNEPYRTRIEGNAWSEVKEMSPELQEKFKQKIDELALRPDKTPLDKRGETNIDQIMGEDHFITWEANDEDQQLNIMNIVGRHEAYPQGSNKKRK